MKPVSAVLVSLVVALPAFAQTYNKHNFSLGLGSGQPRGELRSLFSDSFDLAIGYGWRFHEYFQADIGFETLFGAAGVRDFLPTGFGDLRIRDYQHFLPMGGRAILPLARERILISGGGGGAYMRYTERIQQVSDYFRIPCNVCAARDGWAYYGLFGVNVALDQARHWRIGVISRVYRGHTEGDPLGDVRPRRTRDNWINVMGEMSFTF
jgi:hypothetical protein